MASGNGKRRKRKKHVNELLTEELLDELIDSASPEDVVDKYRFDDSSLSDCLQKLANAKGISRAEAIRRADLNNTFGYQVFVGQRGASRNKVLQLAFALECDLHDANRLLQAAGASSLYCKNRRDAIIIFCITHGLSLQSANEKLFEFGEDTIC